MRESAREEHADRDDVVEPAWWSQVYETAGLSPYEAPEHVSHHFLRAAQQASETYGPEALLARVLTVLAHATSPLLEPDDWHEPYRPAYKTADGRRSTLPHDLDVDELALLNELAPLLSPAPLRARVADVVWTVSGFKDRRMLTVALDAYLETPVSADTWHRSGGTGYRRAVEMARRRAAADVLVRLAANLRQFVISSQPSDGCVAVAAAGLLRSAVGRWTAAEADEVAAHLWSLTRTASPPLGRDLLREVVEWQRRHDVGAVHEAVETMAELYAVQAEDRLLLDGSATAASLYVEKAIATLRRLPRKLRSAQGIEPWLRELRRELVDLREETLEEMSEILSEGIDVFEYVAAARRSVSVPDRLEALVRLATVSTLIDLPSALEEEKSRARGPLSRLVGTTLFATDGRKVGHHGAVSDDNVTDAEALEGVVRGFGYRVVSNVQILIYPAWQVIAAEQRYDMPFLVRLCHESPLVPVGHEDLWARGLHHALSGDFPSAVSVLVPQVEQLVRQHLRRAGQSTLYVDPDDGTEKEKALGPLLEAPETEALLGPSWSFELRTLLTDQLGLNLRNDLAHGLVTDAASWSTSAVYATWHCLRLAVLPHRVMQDAVADTGPADELSHHDV